MSSISIYEQFYNSLDDVFSMGSYLLEVLGRVESLRYQTVYYLIYLLRRSLSLSVTQGPTPPHPETSVNTSCSLQ